MKRYDRRLSRPLSELKLFILNYLLLAGQVAKACSAMAVSLSRLKPALACTFRAGPHGGYISGGVIDIAGGLQV